MSFCPKRPLSLILACGTVFMFLSPGCSGLGPPDRPRNVDATAISQHDIYITWTCWDEEYYDDWTGEYTPVVSYFIYRDGYEAGDSQDLEYEDSGLDPDTLYCYRVSSYWDDSLIDWIYMQESDLSIEVCAWTYPMNTISGSVSLSGSGLEGVLVELIHSLGFPSVLGTTTTGIGGVYSFNNLENSQYTVVPVLNGYEFSPAQYILNLVNESAAGIDFSASPTP